MTRALVLVTLVVALFGVQPVAPHHPHHRPYCPRPTQDGGPCQAPVPPSRFPPDHQRG